MTSQVKWLSNVQCRMIKLGKGKNMKTIYTHILLICLLALGALQAKALNYQNTYHGLGQIVVYDNETTTDSPIMPFYTTSAYADKWATEEFRLNRDGSVNEGVYTSDYKNSSGPRRVKDPDDDEDDQYNGPLGDALIPLMLLAMAFIAIRLYRRRKA